MPLATDLYSVVDRAIIPALRLLPDRMDSDEAVRMMLAIGLQESRFKYRAQVVVGRPYLKGPARGFWQFEQGGGVRGVLTHKATRDLACAVCVARKVEADETIVHAKLETDDVLAAAFARLLLFSDAKPLPSLESSHEDSWSYYARTWRPGSPRRETWDEFDAAAIEQVSA